MKVSEAIEQVKKLKPNGYSEDVLLLFLNQVEAMVQSEVFKSDDLHAYDWDSDGGKLLLAPPPYDMLYISYISAMIDFNNQEYAGYSNNMEMFNSQYLEYKSWYLRERCPVSISGINNFF